MPHISRQLPDFYNFDQDIVEVVDRVAAESKRCSFEELAQIYGISSGPYVPKTPYELFEVLDFKPNLSADNTDINHARVYHSTEPLTDKRTALRAMQLFMSDPSVRLIALSDAAAGKSNYSRIPIRQIKSVWDGDLGALVNKTTWYLDQLGIRSVDQIGAGAGADISVASCQSAQQLRIRVEKAVWIDPVSITHDRSFLELVVSDLMDECQLKRSVPIEHNNNPLNLLSRMAMAKALSGERFLQRIDSAKSAQGDMKATIAWGTDGLMAVNKYFDERLSGRSLGRIKVERVVRPEEDIVYAAIAMQGLRMAT